MLLLLLGLGMLPCAQAAGLPEGWSEFQVASLTYAFPDTWASVPEGDFFRHFAAAEGDEGEGYAFCRGVNMGLDLHGLDASQRPMMLEASRDAMVKIDENAGEVTSEFTTINGKDAIRFSYPTTIDGRDYTAYGASVMMDFLYSLAVVVPADGDEAAQAAFAEEVFSTMRYNK